MKDTAELRLIEQEEVQTDLRELFRGAVKMTLESVLEEVVVELCGAPKGARGARRDVRNGSYLRQLLTSQGHIEVAVPRTRNSGSAADVIGRYKRRTDDILISVSSCRSLLLCHAGHLFPRITSLNWCPSFGAGSPAA